MEQHNRNKSTVINFYTKVIKQKDSNLADKIIKDDYIQHNPIVGTGKAGFFEFLNYLKKLPEPQNKSTPFFRFICNDDFVAVHLSIEFMGQQTAVVDLFRLEDGKLAEHWDASEQIPEIKAGKHAVVEGPTAIEQPEMTKMNMAVVRSYFRDVLIGKKNEWSKYVTDDIIQHNPDFSDGIDALKEYYQSLKITDLYRVIGEGNFVITQSKGIRNNSSFAIYDIYRLENKMIVEHWNVKQEIPEELAHANGML